MPRITSANVIPLMLAQNVVCKGAQSDLRDKSSSEKEEKESDKGKNWLPTFSKEKWDKLFEKLI